MKKIGCMIDPQIPPFFISVMNNTLTKRISFVIQRFNLLLYLASHYP